MNCNSQLCFTTLTRCSGSAGFYCSSIAQYACQRGSYCPNPMMMAPMACRAGYFCPNIGMTSCSRCPPMTAAGPGQVACTECPFGTLPDQSRCRNTTVFCPPGQGATPLGCVVCVAGEFGPGGQQPCRLCSSDTYSNVNGTATCIVCSDPGLDCHSIPGRASPLPGFWSFIDPSDKARAVHTVPCLTRSACLGPVPGVPDQTLCDNTRAQSSNNVECARCKDGFSEWPAGQCVRCDTVNGGMVLLLVLLSWSYVLAAHKLSQQSAGLMAIYIYFVQTALLMVGASSSVSSTGWLRVFGMGPQDVTGPGFPCLGPITAFGRVRLALAMPLIFLTEWLLTLLIHWALSITLRCPGRFVFSWPEYCRSLLSLLLFSYTSLTATSLGFLDCVDYGSARVVGLTPSINCRTDEYASLFPVAAFVLGCCATMPIALAVFLVRRRADIRVHNSAALFHSWAILFESYTSSTFYYHVVILLRRSAYVLCTTIHSLRDRALAFCLLTLLCTLQAVLASRGQSCRVRVSCCAHRPQRVAAGLS